MPTRRAVAAAVASLVGAASAGCTDLLFGEGLTFEATAPRVDQSVLDATGYEEQQVTEVPAEREFQAGGQTRSVRLTNWYAGYDKAVDLAGLDLPVETPRQRAAVFSTYSTPQVEIAGETLNPIDDLDAATLVDRVQDRYEGVDDLERVGEQSATLAGTDATATEFRGDLELAGPDATIEVTLYVTEAVPSGEDFLLAVGAYPSLLASIEDDNVFALMEGVRHDG